MQQSEIREVFRGIYGNDPNFMTPHLICFGKKGSLVWELSWGPGLTGRVFGVTVIELGLPNVSRRDISRCFSNKGAAESFIRNGFQEVVDSE